MLVIKAIETYYVLDSDMTWKGYPLSVLRNPTYAVAPMPYYRHEASTMSKFLQSCETSSITVLQH